MEEQKATRRIDSLKKNHNDLEGSKKRREDVR
jgi:hypothetical protein